MRAHGGVQGGKGRVCNGFNYNSMLKFGWWMACLMLDDGTA